MNTYVRHATIKDLDEAFKPIIEHSDNRKKVRVELYGHSVGVTSLRLRTFAKARIERGLHGASPMCCVGCGLRPSFFAIESDQWAPPGTKPHLNLYGLKENIELGELDEVLFTHDHILARGLGGLDHISNTQVMCSPCNAEKAKLEQAIVNQRNAS